jgi:short-subunit dehydrogenase
MKNEHSIILSISSDIGFTIAKTWLGKRKIIGTYLSNSKKIEYLKSNGVKLYKVNFKKKDSVDKFCKKISSKKVSSIISAVGTQNPISNFEKVNFDDWTDSIFINAINQIRCVVNLTKKRKKPIKVILFAGGGTNNATKSYSAYTLSKIMLIKFSELIDYEMKSVSCSIIGPGFVKTKIHDATINNKIGAGNHYKKTINRFNSKNCVPIYKVVECVDWALSQSKKVVSGRNISLVYDDWGSKKFNNLLLKNTNIYKLRRFGNDKLIRKKPINLKNYNE